MAILMRDLKQVAGLVFTHPATGEEYGIIRQIQGKAAASIAGQTPFAEDGCGNEFVQAQDSSIHFWDHETEELTRLASDWDSFVANCEKPKPVELDLAQVKSAWIDPEFAKQLGIKVPPDGWKKKP